MPTGYTAPLEDGPMTFGAFVWRCARAFGALVDMREEPLEKPIPQRFEPHNYHVEKIEKARRELEWLATASDKIIAVVAADEFEGEMLRHREYVARLEAADARYRAMQAEVEQWTPPTPDHQGLKDFMREQLQVSVHDYRPKPPERLPLALWKQARRERLERDIEYHTREQAEEVKRTEDRNEWVEALRKSVPCTGGRGDRG